MRKAVPAVLLLLIVGCQQHKPLDKSSTNPECEGYSGGYTVRC